MRFSFWLLVARSFANNKCQFSRKHESAIERLNTHWACATATYPLRSPHKWGKLNDGLLGFLNFSILLIALRLMSKIVGSQFHRLSQHASSINYLKSISFKCSRSKLLRKGYFQFGFVELIPCWEKKTSSKVELYLCSEICKQIKYAFSTSSLYKPRYILLKIFAEYGDCYLEIIC